MDEELRKIIEQNRAKQMAGEFLAGGEIRTEDKFRFQCQSCGECCIEGQTAITPPEFARITWFMYRNGMGVQDIGYPIPEETAGLPVLFLLKKPQLIGKEKRDCCVFLSPTFQTNQGKLETSGKWVCDIYPVRPVICRLFPIGRMQTRRGAEVAGLTDRDLYRQTHNCRGMERALKQTTDQTLGEWLSKNLDPEVDEEKRFFHEKVLPAWREFRSGSRKTETGLSINPEEFEEDCQSFYKAPRPPEDPAQDHETIMRWLTAIAAKPMIVRRGIQVLTEVCLKEGRVPTTEQGHRVKCFVQQTMKLIVETGKMPDYLKEEEQTKEKEISHVP